MLASDLGIQTSLFFFGRQNNFILQYIFRPHAAPRLRDVLHFPRHLCLACIYQILLVITLDMEWNVSFIILSCVFHDIGYVW